ncbi:MAG: 5' nucleotidase, NT5C type [Nanoarchaeota archaeon]
MKNKKTNKIEKEITKNKFCFEENANLVQDKNKGKRNQGLRIGIDIDEVVCELVRGYLNYVEKSRGIKKTYEEVFCYNLWEVLDVSKKDAYDLMKGYCNTKEFDNIGMVEGAIENIQKLADKFEIFFITARPEYIMDKTKKFIKDNFGEFGKVLFSSEAHGGDKEKQDLCLENNIGLLVEDHGEHSLKYTDKGIRVLLLDKPWNSGVEHANITRVYNWKEIYNKIMEIKNAVK